MKRNTPRPDRRAGFTLIEIMLVVVIIGLIAAVGLPKIMGNTEKARINTAKAQINMLSTGAMQYEMDVGSYPQSLDQLVNSTGPKWDGPYTNSGKIPVDPWGNAYTYSADAKGFEIKSNGPPGGGKPISSRD